MILYFHTGSSSFVTKDEVILAKAGMVKSYGFDIRKKWHTPFVQCLQLLFLMRHVFSTRLYVCQFAGYHSFLPALTAKLAGKKCLIISGGTDCVSYPGIGYGNFSKPLLSRFTRWSFKLANHLAPKHDSLIFHKYSYDPSEPAEQGIKAFIPELKKPFTVITNGYDADKWKPLGTRNKGSFITLCGGWQFPFQEHLKGIDLVLETAMLFPQYTFAIAGVPSWKKLNIRSKNIEILPPYKNSELPAVFSRYEYYLQLSMAEGFPNALCEAMLCGCIPVVSNVFSMPEIVGDNGLILQHRSVAELKLLLETIGNNRFSQESIRKSIAERYPIEKREKELLQLCSELLK